MHPCTTNSDKRVKTALLESHYKWWQMDLSVPKTKEELSVGIRPGCPATSRRCWWSVGAEEERRRRGRPKIARESKRLGSRVAGKFLWVAGKMSRVRNNPHFLNKLLRELTTFFRIQPCYLSGNVDRNPGNLLVPLRMSQSETISNLKRLIKHSWMVRGSVEKGHLF